MHRCLRRYCRICFWPNWGLQSKPYPLNTRLYSKIKKYYYVMVYCGPGAIYPYKQRDTND